MGSHMRKRSNSFSEGVPTVSSTVEGARSSRKSNIFGGLLREKPMPKKYSPESHQEAMSNKVSERIQSETPPPLEPAPPSLERAQTARVLDRAGPPSLQAEIAFAAQERLKKIEQK